MNQLLQNFQTSDLTLATVLITSGIPLESMDKTNPSKTIFFFNRDQAQEQAVQAYWKKSLRLEPQALFANQRMLKTRLYN